MKKNKRIEARPRVVAARVLATVAGGGGIAIGFGRAEPDGGIAVGWGAQLDQGVAFGWG